jgi:hypothetical protein
MPFPDIYPMRTRIRPDETELVGGWENIDGALVADAAAIRIKELVHTYLTRIAASESGWEILYRDPTDLRLWELRYPQSEVHGGGPPTLRVLSLEEAKCKYNL